MNILLINTNPVVSRLIELCIRDDNNIIFEAVENIGDVVHDRYSVVFIDDKSYNNETKKLLSSLIIQKKILLSGHDMDIEILKSFDDVIRKPFLPSQICNIFQDIDKDTMVEKKAKNPSIFPLYTIDEEKDEASQELEKLPVTKVLDENEIEKIKNLLEIEEEEVPQKDLDEKELEIRKVEVIKQQLEADGLEIVSEEEYVKELGSKKDKKKKKNLKKSKKEIRKFEEALLSAVKGMKVKKIKKLLKNADVSIKIKFKDKR